MNQRSYCCCSDCCTGTICFPLIRLRRDYAVMTDRGAETSQYLIVELRDICMQQVSPTLWISVAGTIHVEEERTRCTWPNGTFYQSVCGANYCPACDAECCYVDDRFDSDPGGTPVNAGTVVLECLDPCVYSPEAPLLNMRITATAYGLWRDGNATTGTCFTSCTQTYDDYPDSYRVYRWDFWFNSCCVRPDVFRCRMLNLHEFDPYPPWNMNWNASRIQYSTAYISDCGWPLTTFPKCCHTVACIGDYPRQAPVCTPIGDETPGIPEMECVTVPHGVDALHWDVQSCDTGAVLPDTANADAPCFTPLVYQTTCVPNVPGGSCTCSDRIGTPCCNGFSALPNVITICNPPLTLCYECDNLNGRLNSYYRIDRAQTTISQPICGCTCEVGS